MKSIRTTWLNAANTDYRSSMQYYNLFTELNTLFNTSLTEQQLNKLNELYNTDDPSNKMIASELFKTIITQNLLKELK